MNKTMKSFDGSINFERFCHKYSFFIPNQYLNGTMHKETPHNATQLKATKYDDTKDNDTPHNITNVTLSLTIIHSV